MSKFDQAIELITENYALTNADVLNDPECDMQEECDAIDLIRSTLKMSTGDFAKYLRDQSDSSLKSYAEIVLDWPNETRSLVEWLLYLSKTLDEHINELLKSTPQKPTKPFRCA